MTTAADPEPTADLSIFPPGTRIDEEGNVVVAETRLVDVAAEFGTPSYVVDEDALRYQARDYRERLEAHWPNSRVLFASKAFPCTGIYRIFAEEGLSCDVAGLGELEMAVAAGFDPQRIYMHGNAKTDAEILRAIELGVGTIIVDNFDDLDRLERWAPVGQQVLLRVIPDIVADTHESMVTGTKNSRFGLPDKQAYEAIARLNSSALDLVGLHCHIGSQIVDLDVFRQIPKALARFGKFPVYNLGGGLGVRYARDEYVPSIEEYIETLTAAAREHLPQDAQLLIEPGRSLVARPVVTIYTVTTVKRTARTFVAVDGGMADNLEIALLQLPVDAVLANRTAGPTETCDVVGRHCESGDRLAEAVQLSSPSVGDVLALPASGAYSHTTANNYNGALKAPVVLLKGLQEGTELLVRRETIEDFFSRDVPVGEKQNAKETR